MPRTGHRMARTAARRAAGRRCTGASIAAASGSVVGVKVWYHLVAALVGFAIAALIVYWVFGHASEEGATQEGSAGSLGAAETTLCGTITPAQGQDAETRAQASNNLPVLANEDGPIPAIREDRPDQKAWFARIQAAAGFCVDEIKVEPEHTTITMSTVEDVSDADAGAFAAAAIQQAFSPPLQRPRVTLLATAGDTERTAVVSTRAWKAFEIAREARNLPLDMRTLAQFRQSTSFSNADLRVTGWR